MSRSDRRPRLPRSVESPSMGLSTTRQNGGCHHALSTLSLSLSRPVSAEAALSLSRAFSSLKSQVNWGRMESWVPLFNIFLNSPTPETDASRWLQESFNAASAVPITTASFLSLLTEPRAAIVSDSSSCSAKKSETKRFDLLCVV